MSALTIIAILLKIYTFWFRYYNSRSSHTPQAFYFTKKPLRWSPLLILQHYWDSLLILFRMEEGELGGGGARQKAALNSFSPLSSTSVGISPHLHSTNVSRATDAIRWQIFFFNLHLRQTKYSVYLTNLFCLLTISSH